MVQQQQQEFVRNADDGPTQNYWMEMPGTYQHWSNQPSR